MTTKTPFTSWLIIEFIFLNTTTRLATAWRAPREKALTRYTMDRMYGRLDMTDTPSSLFLYLACYSSPLPRLICDVFFFGEDIVIGTKDLAQQLILLAEYIRIYVGDIMEHRSNCENVKRCLRM
jgi:hypothetical protein